MRSLRVLLQDGDEHDADLPPDVGTFLRGLSIGALVGAAIAGSLLLQRRRHAEHREPVAEARPLPPGEPEAS